MASFEQIFAMDTLIAAGTNLAKHPNSATALAQLDEVCRSVLERNDLDLEYFDATLRSRPAALNALMQVEGGPYETLVELLLDQHASEDLIEIQQCEGEVRSHLANVAGTEPLEFDIRGPACVAIGQPASAAPGRSPNAVMVGYYFANENSPNGLVMWDRRVFDMAYPAVSMLSCAFFVSEMTYDGNVLPRWQPCPLFRYHPERFKQTRTYLKPIQARRNDQEPPRTRDEFMASFNADGQIMINESNKHSMKFPLKERLAQIGGVGAADLKPEIELFMIHDQFDGCGRQIFDLPPQLVEMFRHTDVEDVPLEMLRSPYSSYFLHFGPQEGLDLDDGWLVDGAYITHIPDQGLLQIALVSRPREDSAVRYWHSRSEPCFTMAFDKSTATMDVGTALDTVLSTRLAALNRQIAVGNAEAEADIAQARQALLTEGVDLGGMTNRPGVSQNAAVRAQESKRRFPVFRDAMRLVVNGICYLTAYPDDSDPPWPAEAPAVLREKATSGTKKEAKRAKSKLEALGYTPVHLAGAHFRRTLVSVFETTDRTVDRHFRRGHWKRQAYGVGLALRKLQWRMPVIVNRDRPSGDTPPGHLYLVD